jgi:predicted amidohydrolase
MVKVRLLQVQSDESEAPRARTERVIAQLPEHLSKTDFLVLPELWTIHAFNLAAITSNSLSIDDEIFKRMADLARAAKTWLHAGTFPIKHSNGDITNSAIVFDPNGEIKINYSKIHLFGFEDGESKYLAAGNENLVSTTPLGETGISTCYDLRFPELYREQTARGANCFLISAGWPTVRAEHWTTLLKARAIENQAFVIAASGRGTANNVELAGQSMVIDPMGKILAQGSQADEYVDAVIDLDLVDKWRSEFPVLNDRRDLHNL